MPQDATNRIEPTQGAPGLWGESDRRDLDAELGRFDQHLVAASPAVPPKPPAASSSTSTE